jgi:hypothetical protein
MLAGSHLAGDVTAWVGGIAARRSGERLRAGAGDGGVHAQRNVLALGKLLIPAQTVHPPRAR